MNVRILPGVVAIGVGAVLVVAAFVPFVARSYRRRGELGPGHALLAATTLVYALGVVAYTLLPLPDVDPGFCTSRIAAAGAQLHPLQFLTDIRTDQVRTGVRGLLGNPAVQQVGFNVALFVPLGALLRHLGRRSVVVATLVGFAISLFIELTQLTGNWFLYPCPYRLFDVDDLIANTAGALVGALVAPVLQRVPGQRGVAAAPGAPRPVTTGRRLLGVLCDLLGLWLAALLVAVLVNALSLAVGGDFVSGTRKAGDPAAGVAWLGWLALFVALPMLGPGGTLGQRAVLLQPVLLDGRRPARIRLLLRSLAGTGGFLLLQNAGGGLAAIAVLWGLVSLVGIVHSREHRGLGGRWTGTVLVDRRSLAGHGVRAEGDRVPGRVRR
ncbi:VanZ family protein [Pseudonocardia xinjiangensis]|uniref:VanZ family protein n=1 Tax=Pseudonocardia xinjiangensis TaxID=75289 RepID=UPI003D8F4CF3